MLDARTTSPAVRQLWGAERLALGGDVDREALVATVVSIWLRSIYGHLSADR